MPDARMELSGRYQLLGRLGEGGMGVVDRGYFCAPGFERDRWLDPLRGHAQFEAAMDKALARHLATERAFDAAGGYQLLEMSGRSRRALP